ncbi:MAG: tetratricopeptide repeat protein [Aureispira sp.]|nr:tetratricopeptide repeat protein [Aureispira sp.]
MDKEQLLAALQQALEDHSADELDRLTDIASEEYGSEGFYHYYTGHYYMMTGDYAVATKSFKDAAAAEPSNLEHQVQMAHALANDGEHEKAQAAFEKVFAADSKNIGANISLSLIAIANGDYDKALGHLDTVLEQEPDSLETLMHRSQIHAGNEDYDKAMADIESILAIDTENEEAIFAKIAILSLQGNNEEAKTEYEKVLAADPDDGALRSGYIEFLMDLDEYADAEKQLDILIAQEEEENGQAQIDLYERRAWIRLNAKNYGGSLADAKKAIEFDGKSDIPYLIAADINLAENDPEGALLYLKVGLDLVYPEWKLLQKRGQILMDLGKMAEAQAAFEGILKDPLYESKGHMSLGHLFQQQGNLDKAFEHWNEADDQGEFDAFELLETHCPDQLAALTGDIEKEYIEEYTPEFPTNAASAALKPLFGKIWKLDVAKTKEKNPTLSQILGDGMDEALNNAAGGFLSLADCGLYVHRPIGEDIRSVYKITDESKGKASIETQPLDGLPHQKLIFSSEGKFLQYRVDTSDLGDSDIDIAFYMAEIKFSSLNPKEQRRANEAMEGGKADFMGEAFQSLVK